MKVGTYRVALEEINDSSIATYERRRNTHPSINTEYLTDEFPTINPLSSAAIPLLKRAHLQINHNYLETRHTYAEPMETPLHEAPDSNLGLVVVILSDVRLRV